MNELYKDLLSKIGEDPSREGLLDSPIRRDAVEPFGPLELAGAVCCQGGLERSEVPLAPEAFPQRVGSIGIA